MKLKNWFDNLPIHNKLNVINVVAVSAALIPVFTILLGYEYYGTVKASLREAEIQANILSDNVSAATAFSDPQAATEILQSLRASPYVVRATVHLDDDTELAHYEAAQVKEETEPTARLDRNQTVTTFSAITVHRRIHLKQDPVGWLTIVTSTQPLQNRLALYLVVDALAALVGFMLAYRLARRLKNGITEPLADLMTRTRRATHDHDYSASASRPATDDEIGRLSNAFDSMLENIRQRDHKLRQSSELAQAATLAKSRFLAAASHDLRQPMHALNMYLEVLSGHPLEEGSKGLLHNAQECSRAMDEMFRAFLDISRLDAGVIQPKVTVFQLCDLLRQIEVEFEPLARNKGLRLRFRCSHSHLVETDREMTKNIIRNLVSNAIRYTDAGKILVACRANGDSIRVQVCDTGLGISDTEQEKIFEEFYQVANPQRDRSLGLGLGLPIVNRLCRLVGATLEVTSVLGKGSCFSVGLRRTSHIPTTTAQQSGTAHVDLSVLRGALIVLVDDAPDVLRATTALLEHSGCDVVAALTQTKVLEAIAEVTRVPDALVCDYRLTEQVTGLDVIERLREEFSEDIPAIIITGETDLSQIVECQKSGLLVLHKPLQGAELLSAVAGLLAPS